MKSFQKCGEVGGIVPTSLDFVVGSAQSTNQSTNAINDFGAKVTATVTSATLTEVLNILGSGYVTFAALLNAVNATVTDPKIRIVIDGIPVLDESSGTTIQNNQNISIVGRFFKSTTGGMTESRINFNSSFVVSIAGDGTDGVAFAYKRVLT